MLQPAASTSVRAATPPDVRRGNSFDFVRFCAASAVLFSHQFDLAGRPEPPVPGYGKDFGELGVEVFFCLSGFLIYLSLARSSDWASFTAARLLRIFPNLAFALVATSAVTLVWYHNYANLWPHVGYVIGNLLMFLRGVTMVVPGIFTDAMRPVLNEPLWTLPYELWLYVLLFALFVLDRRRGVIVAAIAIGIAWSASPLIGDVDIGPLESEELLRLGAFFLAGALLATAWPRIRHHAVGIGVAGVLGLVLLCALVPFETPFHALAVAGAVVGLGSSRAMAWFSRGGDPSYGMYVLAWPVQQFSLLLIAPFWLALLAAFVVTTALGYATWHAFERRALAYRPRLAERLRGTAARP